MQPGRQASRRLGRKEGRRPGRKEARQAGRQQRIKAISHAGSKAGIRHLADRQPGNKAAKHDAGSH